MIIQSTQNPKIKHAVHLQRKNYRIQHQEFLAQGFKVCQALQQAEFRLKTIFMTEPMYLQYQNDFLVHDTYIVSDAIMKHISTTSSPTGIVAIFETPNHALSSSTDAIVLHGIQDPGNLGTLIRSANAMNISHIYMIECVDVFNPKVIQATTGCLKGLHLITTTWQALSQAIATIPLCALVVHSGQTPQSLPLKNTILVIGNEGNGLPATIIDSCNYRMTIPMSGNTESLNAAIAGSIAMYLKTSAQ